MFTSLITCKKGEDFARRDYSEMGADLCAAHKCSSEALTLTTQAKYYTTRQTVLSFTNSHLFVDEYCNQWTLVPRKIIASTKHPSFSIFHVSRKPTRGKYGEVGPPLSCLIPLSERVLLYLLSTEHESFSNSSLLRFSRAPGSFGPAGQGQASSISTSDGRQCPMDPCVR